MDTFGLGNSSLLQRCSVRPFELIRAEVSNRRMTSLAVVEDLDELEDRGLAAAPRGKAVPVHQLPF